MKNVLLITATGKYDGVAYWRVERPFANLPVNIIRPEFFQQAFSEKVLGEWMVDCVYFSDPHGGHAVEMAEIARKAGVSVWVDYDDDYLHVSPLNPFYHLYQGALKNSERMLQLADVATTTNAYLGSVYGTKDIIDNAWDSWMFGEKLDGPANENVTFWRGGTHSVEDLRHPAIEKMIQDKPETTFIFMGSRPYWLMHYPNTKHLFPTGPMTYFNILRDIRPGTFLSPMQDNAFNRGRSRISWYEAVWCGASYIGPDWFDYSEVPMLKDENAKRERILESL